jgi:hypothetical protein
MLRPIFLTLAMILLPLAAGATPQRATPSLTAVLLPGMQPAQYCETECYCEGECEYEKRDEDRGPDPATRGYTDWLVEEFAEVTRHCSYYNPVWRVDCLRDGLNHIAQTLPVGGDYEDMRQDIARTAAELQSITDTYADPVKPPVRRSVEVDGRRRSTTTAIRPVAPQNLPAANAAAIAAVTELSTTLLRSAATNAGAAVHYERAAAAVDETLILLRSS